MPSKATIAVREFRVTDLDAALEFWSGIGGLGLNESDTDEALERFLRRNPGLSAVAAAPEGRMVGTVLCGHDGRRGTLHHLVVAEPYRGQGVAKRLIEHSLERLRQARIPRCNLFLWDDNEAGAAFWLHHGWSLATNWKTLQRKL